MRRPNVRWRLTLWYGAVLAAVQAVFGGAVFFTLRHQLLGRIERGLAEELADVLYEVGRAPRDPSLLEWLDRRFARHEGFDFEVTRPGGERFFHNHRLASAPLPEPDGPTEVPAYRAVSAGGQRWQVVSVRAEGPSGPLVVQVARNLRDFDRESAELLLTLLLAGPLTLVAAMGGGYFLARRALAPVEAMTRAANQITAERLDRRIEVANPDDELGTLARTLNGMIERLAGSFAEMKRFTADAAHELRTPLAVLRNEAEVALRSPRAPEEYVRVLEGILEEAGWLGQVADQLLFLSRQDAGLHPAAVAPVCMRGLVEDVVANLRLVAEEKGTRLEVGENAPCTLVTDAGQVRRVLYNLLDNALKYTGPAGCVSISAVVREGAWVLTVEDTGPGIAPEHLPRVFDRFYRAGPAPTGETRGAGLGLAICRSLVRGLGGTIELESVVGKGTIVRVALPAVNTPPGPTAAPPGQA